MKKLGLLALMVLMSSPVLAEVSEQQARQAITYFYRVYVFGGGDLADQGNRVATQRLLAKLEAVYRDEYDCTVAHCYAAYALRTSAQDGGGASGIVSITPRANGWYRVTYRDAPYRGVTDIKVVESDGVVKLDDYKRIREITN
ncbi:hypothetical protein A7P95_08710 [Eikenella longinqua]|uniref:DUF3828 domain-containing protein n=1 Tax=Eikenella longinqua TaxID=1795827 RepID=A0A1A9RW48_9NEIS|nr:hypothetical protein [Eikenella longinqua]OAM26825.1 hypothetical protein A7P95_08710 [Eikenella longinqua]